MNSLLVSPPAEARLRVLLGGHPHVSLQGRQSDQNRVEFSQGGWNRVIHVGTFGVPGGLPELADNNPWVCADEICLPDALSTLVLIALGPLLRAGLVKEQPVLQVSQLLDDQHLHAWMVGSGWEGGEIVLHDPQPFGTVVVLNAMVEVETPADWSLIDDLFHEAYGRSFFVRLAEEWDTQAVVNQPWANYQVGMTTGEDRSLLTVRVMADLSGKLGASQVIHALNIMTSLEEHLGCQAQAMN